MAELTVKERPILFTPDNVRRILDGTKTQTRRVVKPSGINRNESTVRGWMEDGTIRSLPNLCPYGQPGDRLWVREAFWQDQRDNCVIYDATPDRYRELGKQVKCMINDLALGSSSEGSLRNLRSNRFWRKRPSIFMPRSASRITLELMNVRVERVQEISDKDALAEGLVECYDMTPSQSFSDLWDSINAKRSYGWGVNPWVWVLTFKSWREGERDA